MSKLRAIAYVIIAYMTFFGLYASAQIGRGSLGAYFPPVNWFDSIYYWFQPEDWEQDWDNRV